jgi:hypothetical protein
VLHAGNLIELLEGGVPQSFPVGEQGGQQTNLPLGEALRSPDTYKDVLANFLGAISGSTMIPEMFKAPIMNKMVPGAIAAPGIFQGVQGADKNLDTGAFTRPMPSGALLEQNPVMQFMQQYLMPFSERGPGARPPEAAGGSFIRG